MEFEIKDSCDVTMTFDGKEIISIPYLNEMVYSSKRGTNSVEFSKHKPHAIISGENIDTGEVMEIEIECELLEDGVLIWHTLDNKYNVEGTYDPNNMIWR